MCSRITFLHPVGAALAASQGVEYCYFAAFRRQTLSQGVIEFWSGLDELLIITPSSLCFCRPSASIICNLTRSRNVRSSGIVWWTLPGPKPLYGETSRSVVCLRRITCDFQRISANVALSAPPCVLRRFSWGSCSVDFLWSPRRTGCVRKELRL